ncbi:MAG: ABC exporter membrane fusion protein [Leptolyngbyaceae cyanobacterium bins.59]|nr:ABC exporter membrane fusion protein [Leptolyngbyaceae cyanobacterium bins.59]
MFKVSGKWTIALAVVAGLATVFVSVTAYRTMQQSKASQAENPTPAASPTTSPDNAVIALGRVEPEGEVIKVGPPSTLGSARIARLLIQEGDRVQAGQIIAEMDSYSRSYASVVQAEAQVKEAESRLAQVRAGAKQGDIAAQRAVVTRIQAETREELAAQNATIARLDSELRIAQREYQRNQTLFGEGAISASALDARRLELETSEARLREARAESRRITASAQEQLRQSQATLASVSEVRPTDIQQAEAQVAVALANLQRAQTELNETSVRSPITGRVLKVHAKTGEVVGTDGIAELGKTDRMFVVAEVYETDIGRIKKGQSALISGAALDKPLTGTVERVALQIRKKDVLNTDPAADVDARVVEVRIRLADSRPVSGLTNLQVNVKILPRLDRS